MQFQVPQFIEVEDKIFGSLTLKQFLFLAGGAACIFLLYAFLPLFLVILIGAPVAALSVALTFFKPQGQTFLKVMEHAFAHFSKTKIYTWKKRDIEQKTKEQQKITKAKTEEKFPKLTKSKLSDLAWSLDIKENKKQQTNQTWQR